MQTLCVQASVCASFLLGGQLWDSLVLHLLASYGKQKLPEALWAQTAFWCGAMSSLPGAVQQ